MNSFTKAHRLQKADEYSSVFVFRKVRHGTYFKIHYKPSELQHSRLGFIVSKKNHKRANRRNYMKRIIREYFRTHQQAWLSTDIIIRVQRPFAHEHFKDVVAELDYLCYKFLKDRKKS